MTQQAVQEASITAGFCGRVFSAFCAARQVTEAVPLEPSQLPAGYPAAPFLLCQVDVIQGKLLSLFCLHFLDGLCYTWGKAITI